MSSDDVLRFLQEHSDWLSQATFWRSIGQMILFGILRFLYRIAVFAEELVDAVLLARTFLENERIAGIFTGMLIFSVSLTTLTLMIIAVRKLINPRIQLKAPVVRGLLTVALISSLPGILIRGLEVSVHTFEHTRILGVEENTSISMAIIRENVADMHFLANHPQGFELLQDSSSVKNTLNDDNIWHVDFNQVITPSDIGRSSSNVLYPLRYRTRINSSGELTTSRIRNGWFDLFDEGYFRWTANWGVLYTTMPIITIFMFCTAFMLLTTLLDLIFLKILIPILAPTDLETGQKMKHIAKDALAAMLSIALIGVSLSVFRILLGLIFELDINFMARLIYLSVAMTVCMKGSSAFGKYLGVDVGMGSGMKSLLKLGATGMLAAKGVNGAKKVIQNGVPKAAEGIKKTGESAKNDVGNASESIGKLGAEITGMGAKDFMKAKAMNATDSLKEGLSQVNPLTKMKTGLSENIGDKFKAGQASGDEKVMENMSKMKSKQQTNKRKNSTRTPFAEREENHKKTGSVSNDSTDIFSGSDIELSNGTTISKDIEKSESTAFTLPQFDTGKKVNVTKKNDSSTAKKNTNPFDKAQGVSALSGAATKKQTTSPPISKPIGTPSSTKAEMKNPVTNTPRMTATPKVGTPHVTNKPRVKSTPQNVPKVTSSMPVLNKKNQYEEPKK